MHSVLTFLLIYGYILRKCPGNIFKGFLNGSLSGKFMSI